MCYQFQTERETFSLLVILHFDLPTLCVGKTVCSLTARYIYEPLVSLLAVFLECSIYMSGFFEFVIMMNTRHLEWIHSCQLFWIWKTNFSILG